MPETSIISDNLPMSHDTEIANAAATGGRDMAIPFDELPVIRYSADSPLRHPVRLVKEISLDVWRCRELVWILFMRDLKAGYRQSYLGYFWIFAPILGTTVVWMFLNSQKVVQVAKTPIPYPAFVLIGTMLWSVFTASVNQPLGSFNAGKAVFMKMKVPPEAFIMAGLGGVLFNLLVRMLVLIPVFLALKMVPASTALLFPIGLLCMMLFGVSIGILLIPLGSLYTDIKTMVSMGMQFLMYLTPVVYPPPKSGLAHVLMQWNPVAPFVVASRDWLTLGHNGDYALPMLLITMAAAGLLLIGLVVLRVTMPHLVVRMGM